MKEHKHANITCKMTLHKEHHSSMYAATFCKHRCVALLPNVKENPPMYILNDFRDHSIPVGKCRMLFCKIESFLELLQHGLVLERVPS